MTPVEAVTEYARSIGVPIEALVWGKADNGWTTLSVAFEGDGTGYLEGSLPEHKMLLWAVQAEAKRKARAVI